MALINDSRLEQVFYKFGPGYIRAPFVLAEIGGHEGLMPFSDGVGNGMLDHDDADVAFYLGRGDFGFFRLDPVVIEEHQMGDFQGQPDNWLGVHRFSMI